REKYDELYGADDAYWMLQNNVMQLKWQQELREPVKQMAEWTYPYVAYVGQYDVNIPEDTELGRIYSASRNLWGKTLPQLLLAGSDEEFDEILADYLEKRDEIGYALLAEEETRQMNENKKKLGLD
ncbi:MAG: ABC transporter substrate-binding protein, partial [Lachnospiraceae bacterium]|nr:ABC transporter substrate-binding protein [Lachnospiraceae bacterium]